MDEKMTRGKKIRELMKNRKMKPGELMRAAEISRATMSRLISKDDHRLDWGTIERVAKALEVSPGYLHGGYKLPQHLSEEDIAFIADQRNATYLKLVKELLDRGILAHELARLIKILSSEKQ